MRALVRGILRVAGAVAVAIAGHSVAQDDEVRVDLELILATDTSQSVDGYEGWLQRQGYVQAMIDDQIVEAILGGFYGRIAVTYVEWAGPGLWRTVVPWRLLASAEDAREMAVTLDSTSIARGAGTSITGVIAYTMGLFDDNGFNGDRRVIDISGDGPNSSGGIVTYARDAAVLAGITVNGVPINNFDGSAFTLPDLDVYYRECVIGGPGAFAIAADGFESFGGAILRKMILEIAGSEPDGRDRIRPPEVQVAQAGPPEAGPLAPAMKYAPACDIGERMRLLDNPNAFPDGIPRGPPDIPFPLRRPN